MTFFRNPSFSAPPIASSSPVTAAFYPPASYRCAYFLPLLYLAEIFSMVIRGADPASLSWRQAQSDWKTNNVHYNSEIPRDL
jgi:hypothetical protein